MDAQLGTSAQRAEKGTPLCEEGYAELVSHLVRTGTLVQLDVPVLDHVSDKMLASVDMATLLMIHRVSR